VTTQYADEVRQDATAVPNDAGDGDARQADAALANPQPSDTVSIEDVLAMVRETVQSTMRPQLDALYKSVDQRMERAEQLRTDLTELAGNGKRMQAAIDILLDETVGAERRQAAAAQITEKIEQDEIRAENARLKAAVSGQNGGVGNGTAATQKSGSEATGKPDVEEDDAPAAYQKAINAEFAPIQRAVARIAAREGVDLKTVIASDDWPKDPPLDRNNRPLRGAAWTSYWAKFQDDAEAAVHKHGDAANKEATPRQRVENTQPVGGGNNPLAVWRAYGAGQLPWGPQVIAAGKAVGALD
jgi:hypothetical protein